MIGRRRAEALSRLNYLWKTDDKAWMKQRRADWKHVEGTYYKDGATRREIRIRKKFFLYGENDSYIPEEVMFFSVPVTSADEARQVFESDLFRHPNDRYRIMGRYLIIASLVGEGLPWLAQHIRYFVDGVLGKEYRLIEVTRNNGLKKRISPEPGFWCDECMVWMVEVLSGALDYHGCVEAVDYFVSALAHADDPKFRSRERFDKLIALADSVSADAGAPAVARELASKLKARKQELIDHWALHADLDTAKD